VTVCVEQTASASRCKPLPQSLKDILDQAATRKPASAESQKAFAQGFVFAMDIKDAEQLSLTSEYKHWWKTRVDPFADAWSTIEGWLIAEPSVPAHVLMDRLAKMIPALYGSKAQLRTLQRRIKTWRAERAKEMVLGSLKKISCNARRDRINKGLHHRQRQAPLAIIGL